VLLGNPLPKVISFLSFQTIQDNNRKMESNIGLAELSNPARCRSHQAATDSLSSGMQDCNPSGRNIAAQSDLVVPQPSSRCCAVSGAWSQRAQVSDVCKPCLLLRSAVQSLLCSASHAKNLTHGGARAFQSSWAPNRAVEPTKNAL
jgi:hypothetical protein